MRYAVGCGRSSSDLRASTMRLDRARRRSLWVAGMLSCVVMAAWGQDNRVSQALDTTQRTQKAAAESQQRIDQLDDQTRSSLERYRAALWQAQQLRVYVQQIDELQKSQQQERESLSRQITEMERVERDLLPLMLRMIGSLETFVGLDLPFLQTERRERVAELRRVMADASVGTAEKFRRIIEAYQIEVDYGRGLGAERVEIDGRLMDQLRVGRSALFALALDADEALRWDAEEARWVPAERRYISDIRDGLRIARETAAPSLLVLPMPLAQGVQP